MKLKRRLKISDNFQSWPPMYLSSNGKISTSFAVLPTKRFVMVHEGMIQAVIWTWKIILAILLVDTICFYGGIGTILPYIPLERSTGFYALGAVFGLWLAESFFNYRLSRFVFGKTIRFSCTDKEVRWGGLFWRHKINRDQHTICVQIEKPAEPTKDKIYQSSALLRIQQGQHQPITIAEIYLTPKDAAIEGNLKAALSRTLKLDTPETDPFSDRL